MKTKDYEGKMLAEIREDVSSRKGVLKIGCKDSTGFFWCGHNSDFTAEEAELTEKRLRQMMVDAISRAWDHINKLIKRTPTPALYIMNCWKENESLGTPQGYELYLAEYWEKLERAKTSLNERRRNCEERKPLMDRKVIEAYESTIYPNETILLVEGVETFNFWDIEECRKAVALDKFPAMRDDEEDGETDED